MVPCIYIAGESFSQVANLNISKSDISTVTIFENFAKNMFKTSTWDGTFPNSTLSADLFSLLGTNVRGIEGAGTWDQEPRHMYRSIMYARYLRETYN